MKNVYIVLSHSGSVPSRLIRLFKGAEYTHSSFATESSLSTLYSFGRKKLNNPLIGGFITEHPGEGMYRRFPDTVCRVLSLPVSDGVYAAVLAALDGFERERDSFGYSFLGVFLAYFHIRIRRKRHMYCTEFVRFVLETAGADVSALPEICLPADFLRLPGAVTVYTGLINNYRAEKAY